MEEQACEAEMGCVGAEVYGKGMGDERETTECRKRWSARGADGCWFSLGSNGDKRKCAGLDGKGDGVVKEMGDGEWWAKKVRRRVEAEKNEYGRGEEDDELEV